MIEWKPEYSCNIATIDQQHKRLFELVGNLYDIFLLKDDGVDHYDELVTIFNELSDYTVYHFDYEEKLMEAHQYSPVELKVHKLEHQAFINKISKLMEEDIDNKQTELTMDAIMFAADWVEKHILHTDMKYKPFLNSKGIN